MLYQTELIYSAQNTNMLMSDLAVKLHGVAMNIVPYSYAQELHNGALQPYSLYCRKADNGSICLTVSALTDTAAQLCDAFAVNKSLTIYGMDTPLTQLSCKHRIPSEISELSARIAGSALRIEFISPATFKNSGRAYCSPELYRYFTSVAQKYSVYGGESISPEVLCSAIREMELLPSFSFKSVCFNVSGTLYNGMTGFADYALPNDIQKCLLLKRILSFAEYSGIGAKTPMGMGGIKIGSV